ncbi:hypothetical protein MesoLjLb_59280 [Mesorhizobium sp. L-8-3]|nr:hypothetical protein MesoLjLb_59280 [Mesorhizobium sp. L-8-3]
MGIRSAGRDEPHPSTLRFEPGARRRNGFQGTRGKNEQEDQALAKHGGDLTVGRRLGNPEKGISPSFLREAGALPGRNSSFNGGKKALPFSDGSPAAKRGRVESRLPR